MLLRKQLLSIVAYSGCSTGMILVNKVLLSTYSLPFPIELVLLQSFTVVILLYIAKLVGLIKFNLCMSVAIRTFPHSLSFSLMIFSSLKSLLYLSISAQTALKNSTIVGTAIGDHLLYGRPFTPALILSFFFIILGTFLGANSDPWTTSLGILWMTINILCTIFFSLYFKYLLTIIPDIGYYAPICYNNAFCFFLFFPLGVQEYNELFDKLPETTRGTYLALGLMLTISSALTVSVIWCMTENSPTTMNVIGALNKLVVSILGIFLFKQFPTPSGYTGMIFCLLGGVLYAKSSWP